MITALRRFKGLLILAAISLMVISNLPLAAQDDLNYNVSVEAMLVPLFAVDSKGNPINDLKQEELVLRVNGQPVKIDSFKRFQFQSDNKITETVPILKEKTVPEPPERVIFIIIDSVFNSSAGLSRSRKIAADLVSGAPAGDRFILIENTPGGGLKHLAGPDGDRRDLLNKINKIVPQRSIWIKDLYSTNDLTNIEGGREYHPISKSSRILDGIEYESKIKQFSRVLSRFKYVLKTVTKPKVVFLISEGPANKIFKIQVDESRKIGNSIYDPDFIKQYLYNYLNEIIKAVNQGGSVLYTINPQDIVKSVDSGASGEMSLRYLADESGGKYFAGSDAAKIVTRIRKTTTAYYELAFTIPSQMDGLLELDISCNRKDVKIHTLRQSERSIPYHQMEPVQKKVFALNLVTGGSWSRMLAKVYRAKYKKSRTAKNRHTVSIKLPNTMKNCDLDIYIIYIDPAAQSVDMAFETGRAAHKLELGVQLKKGKDLFFAVIDPKTPYCIYNRVN